MEKFTFHAALRNALAVLALLACFPSAAALPDVVAKVKGSVVGIGSHLPTRRPAIAFHGTGLVVADGLSVITNAHVARALDGSLRGEVLGIVTGQGDQLVFRPATVVALDHEHDLAHLRLTGQALPALPLAAPDQVREGQPLAFTGFPLGMTLGLNAATHRALLAAITPIVLPSLSSRGLSPNAIKQLRRAPFAIYQLDATAYPGNSGSPVYHPDTGAVHGVINMVYVKGLKESAISAPSGITYAIPVDYVHALLQVEYPKSK